ncbi:MAG: phenylacetate--CoA ligase family protein, partial [Chitinophagaceae bacterium]
MKYPFDLSSIPFTTKENLQQRNNEFLCVTPDKVLEYTLTSGTLGKPVTIALTEKDLNRLALNEYHSFQCTESTENDIFQLMITLDRQFMSGIAYHSGLVKLGAGIIRVGPGVPSLQLSTIERLKPTVLIVVPSFLLKLIHFAENQKMDLNQSSVKKAICIGENIRNSDFTFNALGKKISEAWNIQLFSTYASTEMQTAFTECRIGQGGHLQNDLMIVEIVDSNNQQVPPKVPGEVVITTLGVEGMPLLRYKTGDICMYFTEP